MRSLVEDDPEHVEETMPEIDQKVVEKTETFWSLLKSIFGGIVGATSKVKSSKSLGKLGQEVWRGSSKSTNGWLIRDLKEKRKKRK